MPPVPAISIITPHLNNPAGLARCLDALMQQRKPPSYEVIVVDNGSTQHPSDVCDRYDGVRLLHEDIPGPGPARTTGAKSALGEILTFIDSDCIADPDWVRCIFDYFAKNPGTDVIGGDVRIARKDVNCPTAVECYESVYGYRMSLYVARDNYTATCNMAVRRKTFEEVGAFAGIEIAEDVDWGRRATALGARIDYVPSMTVATPARENFDELIRKWDRHISHDYAEVTGVKDKLKWGTKALLLLASPLVESIRIVRAERLTTASERWLALVCLARIRLYRCRRMFGLLLNRDENASGKAWRRSD